MNKKTIITGIILATLSLSACDNSQEQKTTKTSLTDQKNTKKSAVENLADIEKQTYSFKTGPILQKPGTSIYIFFDPQCPHCNKLWQNAHQEQAKNVSIVWIPVAFLNNNSLPQAATILSSEDPQGKMKEHEDSMSSGGSGLQTNLVTSNKFVEQVNFNNKVFDELQGRGVPLLLKASKQGEVIALSGELSPEILADFSNK